MLVSRRAHGAHHRAPFEGNYCIVSGIWNPILDQARSCLSTRVATMAVSAAVVAVMNQWPRSKVGMHSHTVCKLATVRMSVRPAPAYYFLRHSAGRQRHGLLQAARAPGGHCHWRRTAMLV